MQPQIVQGYDPEYHDWPGYYEEEIQEVAASLPPSAREKYLRTGIVDLTAGAE